MSISILGGHAKGHALFVPKGDSTRPTTVMLRRKFFDAHQDCSDMFFVDLCAGTGAMGLEAASRGASKVILVEKNKFAFNTIKKNISSMKKKLAENTHIESISSDSLKWIKGSVPVLESQDIVLFFDPPYEDKKLYLNVIKTLQEIQFSGDFWLESDRQKGFKLEELEKMGLSITKTYKQGTSYIAKIAF